MSTSDADRVDDLDAVAIVGMAGRFPGADSLEQFWHNLRDGVESIAPVSVRDMLDAGVDPAAVHDPHRVAAASALSDVDLFDSEFFDIPARQAELTDPQQRLFLECAWEALESAGYDPATHGRGIGVFAGASLSTYLLFHLYPAISAVNRSGDLQVLIGNDKDYLATQVAYKLGLTGPAISVQTACSTSLVAVHLACQSLLSRECDMALAGGVTVRLPEKAGYLYEPGGILSPDGHCRPFDADARGTVFGSGVGAVVLKRLDDAVADGDVIDAVILGSAINNDGSIKAGYTAPSEDGQARVVAEALAMAGVDPDTIDYVEMHGTGTPLGDPIEVAALTRAYRSRVGGRTLAADSCAIGAVKSNLGHLESAAGIAGLVKTVLALRHREIPPTLHFSSPNPAIDFAGTPFTVNTRLSPWPHRRTPRRAGVSSFGIGGTNAHLVLQEPPLTAAPDARPDAAGGADAAGAAGGAGEDRPHLLPLSARTPQALAALARRYREFLADGGPGADAPLADVCWSAGTRRRHHACRAAAVGRDRDELDAQLAAIAGGTAIAELTAIASGTAVAEPAPIADGPADPAPGTADGDPHKVVFVFPGHGSQWIGMGRRLLTREAVFRAELRRCDEAIHRYTGWSPLAELSGDDADQSWLGHPDRVQFALFAVQVALAAWWRSLGVEPDAVVGHSMGEVAAAHVAGALSLDDAVRVLYHRSRLIRDTVGQGRMLAVGLPADQARDLLAGYATRACLAIVNSPKSTVLSGDTDALEAIAATLRERGTFHRFVNIDFASHSPGMDPLLEPLREALRDITPRKATVPIISTVTGEPIESGRFDAGYWARNLREPVLFADATRWLRDHGHDVFVEISAHPILLPSIEDTLYHLDRPATAVPSLYRDGDEPRDLMRGLAALYRAGAALRWDLVCPGPRRYTRLPSYPWQRRRHWIDPPRRSIGEARGGTPVHPLLGRRLCSALRDTQFEADLGPATVPYLDDHRVCGRPVFPAAGYLEMLWQAAAAWQPGPRQVTDVVLHDLLAFADEVPHPVQTIVSPAGDGGARIELLSLAPGTGQWRPHATAQLAGPGPETPVADLAELHERCPRDIAPGRYYERLRTTGLEYGPLFTGIESLRVGDGEAVGRVRLPEPLTGDGYAVHPALLDACLQLFGATFAGDRLTDGTDAADDGHLYLPVGVGSFRVVAPAGGRGTAHAVLGDEADTQDRSGDVRSGDVRLYDEQGRLVAELLGLRVKRISRSALRGSFRDDLADWCYEPRWRRQPRAEAVPAASGQAASAGRWLILADRHGVGHALAERLEQGGATVTVAVPAGRDDPRATHVDPLNPDDLAALLAADGSGYREVIYLWGLDATPAERTSTRSLADDQALICGGALHLTQALVRQPWSASSRLWLVTRGAQAPEPGSAPDPAQAPLWALGRTLVAEHPDLRSVCLDLDTAPADDGVSALLAEVDAARRDAQPAGENQVAFRHGERFVARLVRSPDPALAPGAHLPPVDRPSRLVSTARGTLDTLSFENTARRAPAAGEVEIRVLATGLNFRDVLNALGAYPGDPGPLGLECAGEVCAVGEGVTGFAVGDPVVALAPGSFATFVTAPAALVARKPRRLGYAEAATIPVAFLTAKYGLSHLARIARGDRILIHAASGGLGLAAAQLARQAGAEVFGTAGSEAKRAYLLSIGVRQVMDSRSLDFADDVARATGGRGVDLVLNSLTGDYIPRNLSVLATGGRFVEVGKIGIWDAERVGQVRPDVSYFVLDLGDEARRDPALVGGMLRDLMREFDRGDLRPLPSHLFGLHELGDAFRFMAQARHIGKIVVTQQGGLSTSAPDRLRPDATYLVTGGLGALGRQVAAWLVERGARHLALIGRQSPSAEARAVVDQLTAAGTRVRVLAADVADDDQIADALRIIGDQMPPLRGVVHAAGVLDDGILLRQDWDRWRRVVAPKMRGAWNLHTLTGDADLDFFVMFSSTAALWGSPGQSGYAAGNAFLDALAHARRSRGLPALSINWGGWSDAGLAARDDVTARMTGHGIAPIPPDAGVAALDLAMRQQAAQLAIMPIDWATFLARFDRVPALFTELSQVPGRAGPEPSDLMRRLDAAGAGNRRRVLAGYLTEQARLALGLDEHAPLDPRRPLHELGLDSLMAIEVRSRLGRAVGRPLPATVLFDHPTIEALTGYLADEVLNLPSDGAAEVVDGGEGVSPSRRATDEADLADLSADEVQAVLAEELAAVEALLDGDRA